MYRSDIAQDWLHNPPLRLDQVLPREKLAAPAAGIAQKSFIWRHTVRGLTMEFKFDIPANHALAWNLHAYP